MFNFSGKVALVAGGAGYFGSSICRGLSEQGASVMVADINRERIDAVVKQTSNEFPQRGSKALIWTSLTRHQSDPSFVKLSNASAVSTF